MAFPNRLLSNPTWQHLGLGLTATFFSLGALAIVSPTAAAESLGVIPTTPEGHAVNRKEMIFLGIRDVAVAAALLWFYKDGKSREMGVMTTAWTLVCVTDTLVAMHGPKGWDGGIWTLWGGAGVVATVGLGLMQS
ncbi:hypothetical protein BS50DRAFT_591431 [Corynespora cassiicola Philippines]|uniref:Integral membrane protein n=1 Tax=Corynespora cassiicola Philippines TaxID=1448308 RepID=A0A2T2NCT5_CORCC|nr:hypothetical protein BS50DRAFT_591431 [Corynespora cassiicola Philippines]